MCINRENKRYRLAVSSLEDLTVLYRHHRHTVTITVTTTKATTTTTTNYDKNKHNIVRLFLFGDKEAGVKHNNLIDVCISFCFLIFSDRINAKCSFAIKTELAIPARISTDRRCHLTISFRTLRIEMVESGNR